MTDVLDAWAPRRRDACDLLVCRPGHRRRWRRGRVRRGQCPPEEWLGGSGLHRQAGAVRGGQGRAYQPRGYNAGTTCAPPRWLKPTRSMIFYVDLLYTCCTKAVCGVGKRSASQGCNTQGIRQSRGTVYNQPAGGRLPTLPRSQVTATAAAERRCPAVAGHRCIPF